MTARRPPDAPTPAHTPGRVLPFAPRRRNGNTEEGAHTPEGNGENPRVVPGGGMSARNATHCTSCGLSVALTPDWTLWPWGDGAQLCTRCNEVRHTKEEYR